MKINTFRKITQLLINPTIKNSNYTIDDRANIITVNYDNGKKYKYLNYAREGWLQKIEWRNEWGQPHKDDGPAITKYSSDRKVVSEYWYIDGKLHRDDGPACISYWAWTNGNVESEEWYKYNWPHRDEDDLPSFIKYGHNNNVMIKKWEKQGRYSRDNGGPVKITYYPNGNIESKFYTVVDSDGYRDLKQKEFSETAGERNEDI